MEQSVIAVTIGVGEKYGLLAELAAESCRRRTGLAVHVLGVEAMQRHGVPHPHHLKFRLFQEFPAAETILYFDADMIFLQPFDPRPYANLRELVCVGDLWDRDWITQDAQRVGLAPKEYFNSGFLILNRTHHRKMLETAESLLATLKSPFKDQTVLNAARVQLGIPARWLGKEYNYLMFQNAPEPHRVVIGHMHGMANHPAESIRQFYQFWAQPPPPPRATHHPAAGAMTRPKRVEVVVVNWRRPANVQRIVAAFAAQRELCTITLIDAAYPSEFAVDATTLRAVDRHFLFSHNFGGYNRLVPLASYTARYTYFHDDDMLPGPQTVAGFLRQAETHPDFGVLGQEGRTLRGGRYNFSRVAGKDNLQEVDFVVRGYFVRTVRLQYLLPWVLTLGIGDDHSDEDLLLCSAVRQAGFKIGAVLPASAAEKMNQQELPAPHAISAGASHLSRRDTLIRNFQSHGWHSVEAAPTAASSLAAQ